MSLGNQRPCPSVRRHMRCVAVGSVTLLAAVSLAACGEDDSAAAGDREVEWALVEEPVENTYKLRARFGGSSCTEFKDWEVKEATDEVEVLAIVTFSGASECTADDVYESFELRLSEALGERELAGCEPDGDDRNCAQVIPPRIK